MHFRRVVGWERPRDFAVRAVNATHAFKLRACGTPRGRGGSLLRVLFIVLGIDYRLTGFIDDLARVDLRF